MKPWTALTGITKWILRIAILMIVFTQYYDTFMGFKLNTFQFYIAAVYIVFGVLIFIGGFFTKHNLTVISALILFIASIYMSIESFDGITNEFAFNVLVGAVTLFFVTNGNK